ncbi:hypothetical protein CBR_g17940 [Chara braunii]|uniref:Structural maintenance of chromosomes protein n=1 Tax=Chara braunii TaxID=69332 RepID=A0A388KW48_CHABU|nr:hypothetical protein CBR_g17940 [Chara braunii]|eukprot:GBG74228.1 hypothetical protein CBR_g17940 [Chara braunii]
MMQSFSSVVGPNGSGKSNVIDAMLFVFGKRAKQLRLNKVSELIHNSSNHRDLEMAKVSVHFQEIIDVDDTGYEVVPNSQFVISRTAQRNNTSKYYIDDRGSNFTEVTNLLKEKGVDLDNNRFLILQGEVEQISMMKPKSQGPNDEGLLEYLEDIIGTNKYVEQIEAGAKRLEELSEIHVGMVHRVKMVEKDKDGLESAKNEAEASMLKEAEVLRWKGTLCQANLVDAERSAAKVKADISDAQAKLQAEQEKVAEQKKSLKELEDSFNGQDKSCKEVEAQVEACKKEFKEFERKDIKFREDIKHRKQKQKKVEDKVAKDKARIEEMEKENADSTEMIPKLEEEIVSMTEKLAEEEKQLEKLKETIREEAEVYRQDLAKSHAELEPWDKQINELKARIDVATAEGKLLENKHAAAAQHYEDALKSLEDIDKRLATKKQDLERMEASVVEHNSTAGRSREEEKALLAEEEQLSARIQAARSKVAEMRESLTSAQSQNTILKALQQARDSGRIPGIFGRLGDLGAIDAKYDIAISTACGALDYIVVETATSAQACVELLRAQNLGVATFLILEKQLHLQGEMNQRVQTPEGAPRLFDLVRVRDERLLPAFYFALRNTVVATNLDKGTRIAYGADRRFRRVVTLDGQLFESSGTMSGGGGRPRGGKMGTAVRDGGVSREALSTAERELDALVAQLTALRARIAEITATASRAEKALMLLETQIPKTKMEVEALHAQRKDIEKQLGALKEGAVANPAELARIAELKETIAGEQQQLQKVQKDSEKLRKQIADLQKKIDETGKDKLKKQKASVTKLQQGIDGNTSDINKRKVQITMNKKALQKTAKAITDGEKEAATLADELQEMTAGFKEIEKNAFVVHEKLAGLTELLKAKSDERDGVKDKYNKIKKAVDDLSSAQVDLQLKLDDMQNILKSWEEKIHYCNRKLEENDNAKGTFLTQAEGDANFIEALRKELHSTSADFPTTEEAQLQLSRVETQLKEMKPNLTAIAEYRKKLAEYNERVAELNKVAEERDQTRKEHEEVRKRRLTQFMEGFGIITMKLKEMYQMITLGGDAELELVDSLDPFTEGIVFSVRPPKKSWKNICNLSGGEKTLSSLSLVFALHHYKPTPLYVMDEIDAALDFKNVSIVAHYIKDRTKNAQFVIISLRNNMFELADHLVGIYKTDNCTKSLTIQPSSYAVQAA